MKNWFLSHYRIILRILSVLCLYILLITISSEYINFYEDDDEFNIRVAKFYFVTLPFASALPLILYEIIRYLRKKNMK